MFANLDDYEIKLIDFGFAKKIENGEKETEFVCTPEFQSPEIASMSGI